MPLASTSSWQRTTRARYLPLAVAELSPPNALLFLAGRRGRRVDRCSGRAALSAISPIGRWSWCESSTSSALPRPLTAPPGTVSRPDSTRTTRRCGSAWSVRWGACAIWLFSYVPLDLHEGPRPEHCPHAQSRSALGPFAGSRSSARPSSTRRGADRSRGARSRDGSAGPPSSSLESEDDESRTRVLAVADGANLADPLVLRSVSTPPRRRYDGATPGRDGHA